MRLLKNIDKWIVPKEFPKELLEEFIKPGGITEYDPKGRLPMRLEAYSGYEELHKVLIDALEQSAKGKGRERHAKDGSPFRDQPIRRLQKKYGPGFVFGQASKKLEEAADLLGLGGVFTEKASIEDWPKARLDILGAIVYTAAGVIHVDNLYEELCGKEEK